MNITAEFKLPSMIIIIRFFVCLLEHTELEPLQSRSELFYLSVWNGLDLFSF